MKKLLIASVVAAAFCGATAFASDLPVKAVPPAVYDWTGPYWGLNAGYGWHDPTVSFSPSGGGASITFVAIGGISPASFNWSGFVGGGQIGYNWQRRNWVTGIEADLDYSNVKGQGSTSSFDSFTTIANQKLEWLSTLRGRLGFLATEKFLIFGAGGLAVGERKGSASATNFSLGHANYGFGSGNGDNTSINCNFGATCVLGNQSNVAAGWTLGGGAEWAALDNTRFKIEYLYVNLGDQNVKMTFPSTTGAPTPTLSAKFRDGGVNILRIGFNVKY